MTHGLLLFLVVATGFMLSHQTLGWQVTYQVGYGAFCLMAAMISLTFLWLWARRATPLALGMSFGWAGAASVIGWWWIYNLLDRPGQMAENQALFLALSLYFVGAILHFAVIQRSLGLNRMAFLVPVLGAIGASVAIRLAI